MEAGSVVATERGCSAFPKGNGTMTTARPGRSNKRLFSGADASATSIFNLAVEVADVTNRDDEALESELSRLLQHRLNRDQQSERRSLIPIPGTRS